MLARKTGMKNNPLVELHSLGQSVWLDDLGRSLFHDGTFERLIRHGEICGATSNPKILADAMENNPLYDESIRLHAELGRSPTQILTALAIEDVAHAADLLRTTFDESNGESGFVSIEVSPLLADNAQATVAEALTLFQRLDRPNVFVKIPATDEGLVAIADAIALGCNVNVTLLFGLDRHRAVMEAYVKGLQKRISEGKDIDNICSVASFFLSRIDVLVDEKLEEIAAVGDKAEEPGKDLRGHAAIALAKIAYENAGRQFSSESFRALEDRGAKPQKLLWASTGVKNSRYKETMYVDALAGPGTITTLPMKTLECIPDARGCPAAPHGRSGRRTRPLQRVARSGDRLQGTAAATGERRGAKVRRTVRRSVAITQGQRTRNSLTRMNMKQAAGDDRPS